jgi:hypothetical protein
MAQVNVLLSIGPWSVVVLARHDEEEHELAAAAATAAEVLPWRLLHQCVGSVRDRRDGALALSDLRLLLNQPPGKLGGSYIVIFFMC